MKGEGSTVGYIILGIIAAIILIIYVLLHISIRAYVKFDKSGTLVKVKYCGFTLYKFDSNAPDEETAKDSDKSGEQDKQTEHEHSENAPSQPEIIFTELVDADDAAAETESGSSDETKHSEHAQSENVQSQPKTVNGIEEAGREDGYAAKEDEPSANQEKPEGKAAKMKSDKETADIEDDSDGEKEKKSLKQRWEDIKPFIPVGKKGLKKLLKLIRLRELELHLCVGGADPYTAGMNFARANQAFYPVLALLCTAFSVSIKKTEIDCNYNQKELDFSGSVIVLARPSAIICLAVYLIVNYFIITHKQKKERINDSDNDTKEGNENE